MADKLSRYRVAVVMEVVSPQSASEVMDTLAVHLADGVHNQNMQFQKFETFEVEELDYKEVKDV